MDVELLFIQGITFLLRDYLSLKGLDFNQGINFHLRDNLSFKGLLFIQEITIIQGITFLLEITFHSRDYLSFKGLDYNQEITFHLRDGERRKTYEHLKLSTMPRTILFYKNKTNKYIVKKGITFLFKGLLYI